MKQLELFAGIGGFGLAGHWAGIETVCQVEIDPFCRRVLEKNFPHAHKHDDIHTFDGRPWRGSVDIVSGGFPCQPYSHAGQRKGNDDDRALWPQMFRVIREVRPAWVVGENVAGLITMDGGRVFDGIVVDLEDAGYTVEAFVVPACAVGAPHRRDRVWIVAREKCTTANTERGGWNGRPPAQGGELHRNRENRKGESAGEFARKVVAPSDACCGRRARRPHNKRKETAGGNGTQGPFETPTYPCCTRWEKHDVAAVTNQSGFDSWLHASQWNEHWLSAATRLCRVDDGLPRRVDRSKRLKALGNAIVPQVAYQIFQAIKSANE